MELDRYLRQVTEFAQTCLDERTAPQDMIESRGLSDPIIAACLSVRATVIDPNEENRLSAYLPIGFFRDANDRAQRLASFAFCFDIQYELDVLTVLKQCEPYCPEQRLFASAPTLFSHIRRTDESNRPDLELIARNAIKNLNGSEIYAVDGGYARLSHLLNPGIVNWARATFPAAPMFVRLDPHFFEARQPPQYLAEATLVPANPTWLRTRGSGVRIPPGAPITSTCYVL
jgi:hypothetical protein